MYGDILWKLPCIKSHLKLLLDSQLTSLIPISNVLPFTITISLASSRFSCSTLNSLLSYSLFLSLSSSYFWCVFLFPANHNLKRFFFLHDKTNNDVNSNLNIAFNCNFVKFCTSRTVEHNDYSHSAFDHSWIVILLLHCVICTIRSSIDIVTINWNALRSFRVQASIELLDESKIPE